jgi:uncharacterized OsmC-like protein/fermentation-respiration switch protein FrsA (DUF1100 family)
MMTRTVTFHNSEGQALKGRLELPQGTLVAYAIFAHCFTCSKDLRAAHALSQALTAAGLAVLRFDFTGLGQSDGEFAETNVSSNVSDIIAAAQFLTETEAAPALLVGHSLGGIAVLMAAFQLSSVKAVATIGAPSQPEHVTRLFVDDQATIEVQGEAKVSIGGHPFTIRRQFLEDIRRLDPLANLSQLKRALLILHAPLDNVVSIDHAAELFKAAKHPKSFISLDSADHLLSCKADAQYTGEVIASWAKRYLTDLVPQRDWRDAIDNKAIVVRTTQSYRTEVRAKGFNLLVDEPEHLGGTNSGPNPFDYVAIALAACKSLTLRMYADRKALPVKAVTVSVRHSRRPRPDDGSTSPQKLDTFETVLKIDGEIDATTRNRMLEISVRCPIHRMLESDVQIVSELAEPCSLLSEVNGNDHRDKQDDNKNSNQ